MLQITPTQFEVRYGISLSTQYRWRKEKKIPFDTIGSNILYHQNIIDKMALDGKLNKSAYLAIKILQQEDKGKK
ncbi:hypothetical protein ACLHDG_03120 [Sulfurovum sp. CS9]|uniref:hypothetical protein n=1 Tax=Sulfurovum sp. CS9 TaxID=3391146 RepID=UPI0039E9FA96